MCFRGVSEVFAFGEKLQFRMAAGATRERVGRPRLSAAGAHGARVGGRAQVGQGGFIQLIQNGYISLLPPAIEQLIIMGINEMAGVLDDVLKVFVLNRDRQQ